MRPAPRAASDDGSRPGAARSTQGPASDDGSGAPASSTAPTASTSSPNHAGTGTLRTGPPVFGAQAGPVLPAAATTTTPRSTASRTAARRAPRAGASDGSATCGGRAAGGQGEGEHPDARGVRGVPDGPGEAGDVADPGAAVDAEEGAGLADGEHAGGGRPAHHQVVGAGARGDHPGHRGAVPVAVVEAGGAGHEVAAVDDAAREPGVGGDAGVDDGDQLALAATVHPGVRGVGARREVAEPGARRRGRRGAGGVAPRAGHAVRGGVEGVERRAVRGGGRRGAGRARRRDRSHPAGAALSSDRERGEHDGADERARHRSRIAV